MACLTVDGSADDLVTVIPAAIREVPIASLTRGLDTSHLYIKGVVQTIWPFQRITPKRCLMKIILAQDEAPGSPSVAVFFTGMYADYCKDLQMPAQMCLSNFFVENETTSNSQGVGVQVIMDKLRSDASLWLCLGTPDAVPSTSTGLAEVPGPGTAANSRTSRSNDSTTAPGAGTAANSRMSSTTDSTVVPGLGTAANSRTSRMNHSSAAPGPGGTAANARTSRTTDTSAAPPTSLSTPVGSLPVSPTKGRSYTYKSLADLKEGIVVNVYGVVRFAKPPARTRGTDYSCMVSLIDPSLENNPEMSKLKCLLFARDREKLPDVAKVGDIIRIHRLKVTTFRDELQGGSGPGFSWLLFDGSVGAGLEPKTCFATYTITPEDKAKVESLRTWLANRGGQLLDVDPASKTQTFADVAPAAYFNTVVQVVAVCVIEPGVGFLMRVWDGTKSPYPVYEFPTADGSLSVVADLSLVALACGYTYDVCAFDDHFHTASKVCPGDYVHFTNLHAMVHKQPGGSTTTDGNNQDIVPTLEFCLHRGTSYNRGMSVVTPTHHSIQELKSRLQKVIEESPVDSMPFPAASHDGVDPDTQDNAVSVQAADDAVLQLPGALVCDSVVNPSVGSGTLGEPGEASQTSDTCMQRTATVTSGYRHIRNTAIADMLNHQVPYKFRVKGRVQDFQPKPTAAYQLIHMHCPVCSFLSPVPHDVTAVEETGSEASLRTSNISFSLPPGQRVRSIDAYSERDGLKRYLCPQCSTRSPRKTRRTQAAADPPELEFIMMMRFLVEDGTGWCLLQLCKDEAEYFFHDLRAENLLKDWDAMESIIRELQRLCPQPGCSKKSPIMECFVKSYTSKSGVNYQIFKTLLSLDTSQY